MKKVNLETAKKLFSVKKGGAEIFRLLVKIVIFVLFAGGAISAIYSLDQIKKIEIENYGLNIAKAQTELVKIQRGCDLAAKNNLAMIVEKAKKEKKEVKKDEQQKIYDNGYTQCLFYNGLNIQNNTKKEIKK